MSSRIALKDICEVMEDTLLSDGDVRFTISGNSMWPLLRSRRDQVVLRKPEHLKKYDLPLYRREDGRFVLHRIVRERGKVLWTMGDNQFGAWELVDASQVLGVVRGIQRGGWYISCDSLCYVLYSRIWTCIYPARLGIHVLNYIRRRVSEE